MNNNNMDIDKLGEDGEEEKQEEIQEEYIGNCNLISMDGKKFNVSKRIAAMSKLIQEMLNEDEDDDDDDNNDVDIPLPNVHSKELEKVIEYCTYHVDNPMKEISKPLKTPKINEYISEFDAKFINIKKELIFELILAANYLDIKSLLDLGCAKIASMIKGKDPEQVRKDFNIVGEFTKEEEAAVAKENKWMEQPDNN